MWNYSSEKMSYDEESHTYTLEGQELTSVTTLLKDVNIINNKFYTEEGANNGRRRHLLCELHDRGDLDWSTADMADLVYLEAWLKFKESCGVEIQEIEVGAYHPLLNYAGRVDRLALIDRKPYIIDIKTGAESKSTELQMILYGMMFTYNGEKPGLKVVYLNGKGKYKLREITYKDEKYAMSCVRINQWKERK